MRCIFQGKPEENTDNFVYDDEKAKEVLGVVFAQKLEEIKIEIVLDINLSTFEKKCILLTINYTKKIRSYVFTKKNNKI